MTRRLLLLVPGCFAMCALYAGLLRADDPVEIEKLLKHEIVGPVLPMAEVQRYCEARVPDVPRVESAERWAAEAQRLRAAVLEKIVYRGAAAAWRDAPTRVEWLDTIDGGPGYRIKKLRYEALPGMWIPALLYQPEELSGKVPAILNVNGHTPLGKQYPPKQIRCINQAKRGMLALNLGWLGMGQLRTEGFSHARMNQLDLCGASGLAPFYLCMKRGLDVLLSLEHTDPERVAVTGLSGGGWQTITLSSLDTRVRLANPVAGYSSFRTRVWHLKDLGDSEQTPNDLATLVDYTHLTAMMAPRPTLLTYNSKDDCCFESGYAMGPLVKAARPMFELFDKPDALRTHVNDDPGTHNFELDNRQALYRMLGDFFFAGDARFDAKEIPSDDEVKSQEQLHVELPEPNHDFHTLALALGQQLPREPALPKDKAAAVKWRTERRAALREIVRAKDYQVAAVEAGREELPGIAARFWRLKMGDAWTVPAVELSRSESKGTVILVADDGRGSLAEEAQRLLVAGNRVIAVDPFYFGESHIAQGDWLYAVLVAGVGDRPLGIQASQVAAAARWAAGQDGDKPVTLVAVGPRSSLFALVAVGLEEKAIGQVKLYGSLGSLKEVLEQNWTVSQKPELFCFGLLEAFDIKQLAALAAPRQVMFQNAGERAKAELAELGRWYPLWTSNTTP
ncbi:MAG: acetylxylan esterase [Pirellulales bacterium]|nr:acetylxylan esterase [Pirellulales bacterium]